MSQLKKTEQAARNKANYLKAKEAFNQNNIAECILYYALQHQVKSKPSEKGREMIENFLPTCTTPGRVCR